MYNIPNPVFSSGCLQFGSGPNTVILNPEVILVHGDSEEAVLALEYLNHNGGLLSTGAVVTVVIDCLHYISET